MAAVGTLTHELAHLGAYRAIGSPATLHYGSVRAPVSLDGWEALWTVGAGPLQTVLTGTLGLILLGRVDRSRMRWQTWLATLTALFWSREVFNLFSALIFYARWGRAPNQGDEVRMARILGWGDWALQIPLGLLGLVACALVLRWLPSGWRAPVLLGGVPGSLVGFAIWMHGLGPALLP